MGQRYYLHGLKCGHCEAEQAECYYAPSSGFLTHKCENCSKENIIKEEFTLRAATKEEGNG